MASLGLSWGRWRGDGEEMDGWMRWMDGLGDRRPEELEVRQRGAGGRGGDRWGDGGRYSPCPRCYCRMGAQGSSWGTWSPDHPQPAPPESPGWFPGVVMLPHRSQPLSTQVGLQAHQEAHPLDGAQPRLAPQQRPPGRRLLRLQVPVRSSGGG